MPVRGSIGVALPGLELRVADLSDTSKAAGAGQPGELMAHGSMVAVGSLPDEVKGELACAYVVRREGQELDAEQVIAYSREHTAADKVPRTVVFVNSLPQTSTGKIMRRKLSTFGQEL